MLESFVAYLNDVPLATLTLLVTLGYALGRAAVGGIRAGPAAGTLFAALVLGRLGVRLEDLYASTAPAVTVGSFGFALFIYSVGYEAGPHFFASLRGGRAVRHVLIGISVNVLAVSLAIALGHLLDLGPEATAGVLAGALTSVPTYAAASEVASDAAALAISFTVTYPFGLIGLVLMVQLVPRWTRDPLHRGVETDEELDVRASGTAPLSLERSVELTRAYRVALDGVVDRSLADLDLIRRTGCVISRLHRDGSTSIPHAGTHLLLDDQLLVTGRLDELETFEGLIGPEVDATALLTGLPRARKVRVERREVVGKSLAELGLVRRHRCVITRIERQRILLEPMPGVRLEHGDVIDVTGERDQVRAAAAELGTFEPAADETNIALYAGGVGLGLLLGHLQLHLFSVTLTLGNAGGLILVGLAIGRFQRIGPFHARLPRAARQLVRDLGILLFVAETGVRAGNQIAGATIPHFWSMVLGGIPITIVPVLVSLVIARRVLDVRPSDAWGAICGGMTSSAALHAVRRAADSSEPAISYAAAYAVASVLVTIAGPLVVLLMS